MREITQTLKENGKMCTLIDFRRYEVSLLPNPLHQGDIRGSHQSNPENAVPQGWEKAKPESSQGMGRSERSTADG